MPVLSVHLQGERHLLGQIGWGPTRYVRHRTKERKEGKMFAVGSLRRLLPQASLSRFAAAASGLEAQQGKLKCLLAQPCTSSCPCPCTLCQAHGFCSKPPTTTSGEEEGQKGKGGGKDDHKNTQVGQPVVGINYKKVREYEGSKYLADGLS